MNGRGLTSEQYLTEEQRVVLFKSLGDSPLLRTENQVTLFPFLMITQLLSVLLALIVKK